MKLGIGYLNAVFPQFYILLFLMCYKKVFFCHSGGGCDCQPEAALLLQDIHQFWDSLALGWMVAVIGCEERRWKEHQWMWRLMAWSKVMDGRRCHSQILCAKRPFCLHHYKQEFGEKWHHMREKNGQMKYTARRWPSRWWGTVIFVELRTSYLQSSAGRCWVIVTNIRVYLIYIDYRIKPDLHVGSDQPPKSSWADNIQVWLISWCWTASVWDVTQSLKCKDSRLILHTWAWRLDIDIALPCLWSWTQLLTTLYISGVISAKNLQHGRRYL